ncbi:hypothetical protein Tco_0974544 [Tanacetum coccineum]|uniref:Uncharacterized protein n=1 Tax=Tanacetum coccineum TaxID=301880 RepID=A0ABQ5ED06_9ASTR
MKATMEDMTRNQYKSAAEYAYQIEQATKYMDNLIVWEIREEDLMAHIPEKEASIFYGPQRNPKGRIRYLYNNDLFYLKKIKIENEKEHGQDFMEDIYYLCLRREVDYLKYGLLNSLIVFIKSCVIWERAHDFQLGIESYQYKINLTAPTLTILGIENLESYTIIIEPFIGIVYENSKNEKRVMDIEEYQSFVMHH